MSQRHFKLGKKGAYRFAGEVMLAFFFVTSSALVYAQEKQPEVFEEGYSAAQLEAGASWLSSLSQSLKGMPELPQMNRVIELPVTSGESMEIKLPGMSELEEENKTKEGGG